MKKFYLYTFVVALFFACSKDESSSGTEEPPITSNLKACFTIAKDNVLVGESFLLTNCSEGANSYSYNLGNGETRTEESPDIVYGKAGDYTISLTVANDQAESDTFSKQIEVVDAIAEDFFIFPEVAEGFQVTPIELGINPLSAEIYTIVLEEDLLGSAGKKFYYQELDADYEASRHYLADKPFESNSAFVNFYPSGVKNFVFSRTLDGLYGSQEVTYNAGWGFMNGISPANKLSYGAIADGSNYLYYGTEEDSGIYKTALETRNSSGDAFQVSLKSFGTADAMIGDLIEVSTGYIGFGAVFMKNETNPKITSYRPLLVFFDTNLEVISQQIYDESVLISKINSSNDFNGSYHLATLNNGNIAMYAHGEMLLADSEGNYIKSEFYEDSGNNQALISIGDSYILSSLNSLRKYDMDGNQIKVLNYPGSQMPEIVTIDEKLFFVAGYEKEGRIAPLYGATDINLNLINLNN